MTGDEYVRSVLRKYEVPRGSNSPAEISANAVAPFVRNWAGHWLNDISFSGSYAKGTGVQGVTDVDLFISMKEGPELTLSHIYNGIFRIATNEGWAPRPQNVSIGITYRGVSIDLVPGRLQPGQNLYHSLYTRRNNSWTQTNVQLHVNKVAGSGRVQEIRAIKLWRKLHNLAFPSFFLELMVIDSLSGRSSQTLSANVLHALGYIGNHIVNARVIDPANTNNVVSDDLTAAEKQVVAGRAHASAREPTWQTIIW